MLDLWSRVLSFPELLTFGRSGFRFYVETSQQLAFPAYVLLVLKMLPDRPFVKTSSLETGAALT